MSATLACSRCGREADPAAWPWRCAKCGAPLDFTRTPAPVDLVSLGEPETPLIEIRAGGLTVLAKLEGALPTGSFKDRGSRAVVGALLAAGRKRARIDSSGNAGASLAAYCARAGIGCDVYVPERTAPAKLAQIEAFGARIVRVPGSRADVAAAAAEAADGAVYVPHGWTPWFLAGTETFAHELVHQLGRAPDAIVLPVGSGTLLLGIARGFRALAEAGGVSGLPRLYGVQPTACAPLAGAFGKGLTGPVEVEPGATAAEGTRIARPPRGEQILAAVRETHGSLVAIDDQALWQGFEQLARQGVLAEPTSALPFGALDRLPLDPSELVVVPVTATGLKAIDAIARRSSRS
ncbi:MAG: pyridoxal-phosphate dependent enzyme [Gaiellaceae bacterium]